MLNPSFGKVADFSPSLHPLHRYELKMQQGLFPQKQPLFDLNVHKRHLADFFQIPIEQKAGNISQLPLIAFCPLGIS